MARHAEKVAETETMKTEKQINFMKFKRYICSKVRSSRKEDEEVRGDEPQVGV